MEPALNKYLEVSFPELQISDVVFWKNNEQMEQACFKYFALLAQQDQSEIPSLNVTQNEVDGNTWSKLLSNTAKISPEKVTISDGSHRAYEFEDYEDAFSKENLS